MNWVKCIYQDSFGFLWFGTEDGLNKYDGYSFTVYKHNSDLKNSLNNNNITLIYEDKNNNLWIGTQEGLNQYDRYNDEIVPVNTINFYIECFYEYENGMQLFGVGANGLYLFNPSNFKTKQVITEIYVNDIFKDANNNFWLGTFNGLLLLDTTDYSYQTFYLPTAKHETPQHNYGPIIQDGDGRIWIGTNNQGLYFLEYPENDPQKASFTRYKPDPFNSKSVSTGPIYSLMLDHSKNLWIGMEHSGLNIINLNDFDKNNCTFKYYSSNPSDNTTLSANSVHCIYEDAQNTVFVGVYGGGINYYNKNSQKFNKINLIPNNPNSLINNHVNTVFAEKNNIWIGSESGLSIWNKKTNKYQHYTDELNHPASLRSNPVWKIFRDSRGTMWIGTWGAGLNAFNEKTKATRQFLFNENDTTSIASNNIFDITEDNEGNLWIATMGGGLSKYDYKTDKFTKYSFNKGNQPITTNWIYDVHISQKGELWISTTEAIALIDKKTNKLVPLRHNPSDTKSISYNGAYVIFEDSRQNLWFGTSNGLNIFNRKDSTFKSYKVKDGLPNNSIKGICEDNNNNLWISTNNGLSKFVGGIFHPEKPEFINYDYNDGLQGNEFNARSACKDENGNLYFGGTNGLNYFFPEDIKESTFDPKIVFTDFLIFNKSVKIDQENSPLTKNINLTNEIKLEAEHSVFSIEYAALHFTAQEKVQYAFILEGFDEQWQLVGKNRLATYTNLDAGKYVFKVKASINPNVWSGHIKSINITILPAWWQTKWMKFIYILIALIALYLFRKYTVISTTLKNKLWITHIENEKTEELNRLKFQFFTNISHELRTPLTLILGPVNKLLKKGNSNNELLLIKNNVKRLMTLVDQIIDFRKIESDTMKIKLENTDIIDLLHNYFMNFRDLAEQKQINLYFKSSVKKLTIEIDKDKIYKIISNIISNAIKHTPEKGRVKMEVDVNKGASTDTNCIIISVEDTGKGISENNIDKIFDRFFTSSDSSDHAEGTGIGLHLTKKLIEILGGEISVASKINEGTKFTITLPFNIFNSKVDQGEIILSKVSAEATKFKEKEEVDKIIHEYTVLIIDDNAEICNYIESFLKNRYNIVKEFNPLNVMDLLLKHLPDLIISDVMMPGLSGFDLCKNIKTDIRFSHIPVILLTAKATTEDHITGFDIGADEYIYKPFEEELLKSRVENLLKQREQLRQHFIGSDGFIDKKSTANSLDKEFMHNVLEIIKQNYKNHDFNVNHIIEKVGMSRSVFYKKYKALSNQPINDIINNHRLTLALELLKNKENSISDIAYTCGFSDPSYFSKVFKAKYKTSPKNFF